MIAPRAEATPPASPSGRPVLVATDLSAFSEPAFEAAIEQARERRAELVIAHAYPPPVKSVLDDLFVPGLSNEIEAATCDEALRKLEPLLARARAAGVVARALPLEGSPDSTVIEAARSLNAAVVVIGTHCRRGVRRLLLGSVAANIVAGAPCPVLTVRPA